MCVRRVDVIVGLSAMSGTSARELIGKSSGGRKLIAVLYADMVGYSRLIGIDDVGTLKRLRALRSAVIDPAIDPARRQDHPDRGQLSASRIR